MKTETLGRAFAFLLLHSSAYSAETPLNSDQRLALEVYRELIETDTTHSTGSTTVAAELIARRLKDGGLPSSDIQILGPSPRKGNLVARFRGSSAKKPLLLLAHLDVVEARQEDWSLDPFKLTERDGFFYGRGTTDDKAQAAAWTVALLRLKKENVRPNRDLILALTADEESGDDNGVKWLLENHRPLIDAEYCLNEGGESAMRNGKRMFNGVQLSEKIHLRFRLQVKSAGGHSSRPVKNNAIVRLAEGLVRLGKFDFPARLDSVTRAFFQSTAKLESGGLADDLRGAAREPPDEKAIARLSQSAFYNALMRTTCVPTMVDGGHAVNALPQSAQALVSCRTLPSDSAQEVQKVLAAALADEQISVKRVNEPVVNPPSKLAPDVLRAMERATQALWPGVAVISMMQTGATDGRYLRAAGIPTYGVSGLFHEVEDVRAHGKDERAGVKEFFESQEYLYRVVKELISR